MRKTYSRKALIKYFEKLPPDSRPCTEGHHCPIGVFMGISNWAAERLDRPLSKQFDAATIYRESEGRSSWHRLTSSRIIKIAKSVKP